MKANSLETVLGALVLALALIFFVYSAQKGEVEKVKGYIINARFNQVGALTPGDPVKVSGVKVGQVESITLTQENYLANVSARVDENVKLPVDSSATIASTGLLGGNYLDISPGGDELMLDNNGLLQYTQDAQNLEKLLGQFIFSVQDAKKTGEGTPTGTPPAFGDKEAAPAAPAAPEAAPAPEASAAPVAPQTEPAAGENAVPTPEEIDATPAESAPAATQPNTSL